MEAGSPRPSQSLWGYLLESPEDVLNQLLPDSRIWSCLSIGLWLLAGACTAGSFADWEEALLPDPPGTGWEFLWTCDSMAGTQDELGALRSRLRAITDSGKATKAGCEPNNSRCSELLTRLREQARVGKRTEDSLRERLGRQAAGCPAPGWSRLLEYRSWTTSRDSICARSSDSVCGATLDDVAKASWKASLLSGTGEKVAEQDIRRALLPVDGAGRDAIVLRLAILLDRRGSRDSARALRETAASSVRDPHVRAAANLWKGADSSVAPTERALCLRIARTDSAFAERALMETANLLESSDRPREAIDSLLSWIRATGSVRWGEEPLRHLARLTRKAGVHPDSLQVALGAPHPRWADTLYLLQAREELRAGGLNRGMAMLAGFHVRFPGSALAPAARELLGKARRRDPEVVGNLK